MIKKNLVIRILMFLGILILIPILVIVMLIALIVLAFYLVILNKKNVTSIVTNYLMQRQLKKMGSLGNFM